MKSEVHILLCFILKYVSSFPLSRPSPCADRGTALVEQFFNAIFAEFPHSPPACVCVQMCPHQLTYCYPNGCFKPQEKRETVSRIHEGFMIEDVENSLAPLRVAFDTTEVLHTNAMNRPNPFKDIVFKYKKGPKLQMKYNLREQVKHTREKKAEVDVSKTRWPTNKQLNRSPYKVNNLRNSHYFTSAPPEPSKHFKRYLTKRENQNELDIDTLHLYKDASNFSVDILIDKLIERSIECINRSKINTSKEPNDENDKDDTKLMRNVSTDRTIVEVTSSNDIDSQNQNNNEITYNISEANINETAFNDYYTITNGTTSTLFGMITTLSHEIDQQNKASIEKVELLTGSKFEKLPEENITANTSLLESVNRTKDASDYKINIEMRDAKSRRNEVFSSLHRELAPVINGQVKKSKQRVVRKLRNRKVNK